MAKKNLYLIRHAPTVANLTGQIMYCYNDVSIFDFTEYDAQRWHSKFDHFLPKRKFRLYSSPALRCMQTAEVLFPERHIIKLEEASGFDCSSLGERKFWEVSQIEFENLIHFSCFDMARRVKDLFRACELTAEDNIVIISHGMLIRYLYHFMRGDKDIAPFYVLNSTGFTFHPLDMLYIKLDTTEMEVYRNE